jgi:hypothetical protein
MTCSGQTAVTLKPKRFLNTRYSSSLKQEIISAPSSPKKRKKEGKNVVLTEKYMQPNDDKANLISIGNFFSLEYIRNMFDK